MAVECTDDRIAPVLEVTELMASDFGRWDTFVKTAPGATFFHLTGWKIVLEKAFGHRAHFLYVQADGNIEGILPLAEIKSRLFGHALISLPFGVYGGIVASSSQARVALNEAAQALAKRLKVGHLEYRNVAPFQGDGLKSDVYVTFRKTIDPNLERNLLAIPRKQRAMVRKGIKAGLLAEFDDDVERFFALYADNVHRHGTPALPKKYFALLKDTFGAECEVMSVTLKGKPISGVMTFYFRDEVLPYYAGDFPVARDLAANDFKYWELMRRACERGYKVFDYGRSKRGTGSFDFKKNWGFEATPLHYEYKLINADGIPQNNPLNPKYRLLIATWRRLPIKVANWLGPHIVKHLG